jgi:hypothetical protein
LRRYVLERSIRERGRFRRDVRMSNATRRIDDDSSRHRAQSPVSRGAQAARRAATATVLVGALAALAATVLPVLRVEIAGAVQPALDRTGWDLHGPVLIALALLAVLLLPAAARGASGAAAVIVVAGLVIIGITVIADLPDVGDSGLVGARLIEGTAKAGAGAYAEALAGVLLVLGGGVLAFLREE